MSTLQPIATAADICAGAELLGRIAGRQYAHSAVLEAHAGGSRSVRLLRLPLYVRWLHQHL